MGEAELPCGPDLAGYGYVYDAIVACDVHGAIQVELLSWRNDKDMSGDGGVLKTIITEGSGWEKAKDADEVTGENLSLHVGSKECLCITNGIELR